MQFLSALFLAAVATATPILQSRATSAEQLFIKTEDWNKCGGSSFNIATSRFSADVKDCQCIVDNLALPDWKGKFFVRPVDGSKFGAKAVECQSCQFLIQSSNDFGTNVGAQDVMDLIKDSITKFAQNGKVGAWGEMDCENDNGKSGPDGLSKTRWEIGHSLGNEYNQ